MDNQPLPPWEVIDPELTSERLLRLATLIRDARAAKIARRDPRDMNWNLMCDCHAWVVGAFHAAASNGAGDWLKVLTKETDLDVLVLIGGKVPLKFYRPEAVDQPIRTLRQSNQEVAVIQHCLDLGLAVEDESVLRLAVSTDSGGLTTAVALVQFTAGGDVTYSWLIWAVDAAVVPIESAPSREGVVLQEPNVGFAEDEKEGEADLPETGGGA